MMFWKKRRIIIIATTIITIIGIIYSFYIISPKYKASATLLIGKKVVSINDQEKENEPNELKTENIDNISKEELAYIVKSTIFLREIKDNLRIDITEEALRESIKIKKISKTELIEVSVISENSRLGSEIVNEIANTLTKRIEQLYNTPDIHVIDYAYPTEKAYNINHIRDILVFFIAGLMISCAYIYIIPKVDKSIKNVLEVETDVGLKVLSSIPNSNTKKNKNRLEIFENEEDPLKKSFDTLKTNIEFLNINNNNKVMLVTSCFSSEGRSYVTANLATIFAKEGKKVVIIDADMRKSIQSKIFNTNNIVGFSNYLSNLDKDGSEINDNINKIINETEIKNLNIITSGTTAPNHLELLSSDRLPKLIGELSGFYDLVILDGPPVLPLADSLVLTRLATSTIIVSLYKRTKKDELLKAKIDIQNVGGKITGVVLNGAKRVKVKKAKRAKEVKEKHIAGSKISIKLRIHDFKQKTALIFKNIRRYIGKRLKSLGIARLKINEEFNNYKLKTGEKQKIKQNQKLKKAEQMENRKELEIEEKTKIMRIREEEKIRKQKIKEIEREKRDFKKNERKSRKELDKQRQKEELRIKEELSEDNLYPKIKNLIRD